MIDVHLRLLCAFTYDTELIFLYITGTCLHPSLKHIYLDTDSIAFVLGMLWVLREFFTLCSSDL